MDDLCTSCLCTGRNLHFIGETGSYHLYAQILNEIPVYDLSQLCVRVCWECRALLRRFQLFKHQVKKSYSQLLLHLHQNTPPSKHLLVTTPHLQIKHVNQTSYPVCNIKLECDGNVETEGEVIFDNIKIEPEEITHEEPQTFVNDLEGPRTRRRISVNRSTKKPKKKLKTEKRRKKAASQESLVATSDGFSDLESVLNYYEDENDCVKEIEKKEGNEELKCEECDVTFKVESQLKKHRKTEHKNRLLSDEILVPICPLDGIKVEYEGNVPAEKDAIADGLKSEANVARDRPQTSVNGLEKSTAKKKEPIKKQVKKKLKTKLKVKKRRKMSEEPLDVASDGFSDLESVLDYYEDENNGVKENENNERKEEFKCEECDVTFGLENQLKKHRKTEHKVPQKPVKVKVPKAPADVTMELMVGEKPQCVECGKIFSSKKTYRYHLNVLHKGQNRYPCPRCGKVYQWKSNLGRHMRTHKARDSGELYCETCDKRFASVATYRQHLRVSRRHVSESEFSFMCNECGKKFVNKTRLRDHIDWEHLKKIKFRCQLCNKPFKCHTSLYVHMQNVHRNKEKKDNLCHVCGKSYQNAAKLKYHIIAMHTSETPYQCQECNAAFGWYSSLYRHVREVHYKMKVQPKKSKKGKKSIDIPPPALPLSQDMGLPPLHQPGT